MRLYFKQRFFSWFDSYDIYDEAGAVLYTVQGQLAWGHKLQVCNALGQEIATLREQVLTLLPRFNLQINGEAAGSITKQFTLFRPAFSVDCRDWRVEGSFWEWDYRILSPHGTVARIEKQFFSFTDSYVIDVNQADDALLALLVVLAIDAVKCGQN